MCEHLQYVIMGRERPALRQAGFRLGLVEIIHLAQAFHVGHFKIIFAVLELFLAADLAVLDCSHSRVRPRWPRRC